MHAEQTEFKELAESFGWEDMGAQKNIYMQSFSKEDKRANYYFTTGTLTIQSPNTKIETYHNVSLEEVEIILSK